MDFSAICRLCLGSTTLNPIFVNNLDEKCYSAAVFITTGIRITANDELPQQICILCIEYLNKSLRYRRKCKEAEMKLLKIKNQRAKSSFPLKDCKQSTVSLKDDSESKTKAEFEDSEQNSVDESVKLEIDANEFLEEEDDKTYQNTSDSENSSSSNMYLTIKEESNQEFPELEPNTPIEEREYTQENDGKELIQESDFKLKKIDFHNNSEELEVPFDVDPSLDSDRVICKLCKKNLSKLSIDSHMETQHPGKDGRKVKCDLCDKYVVRQKLNRHRMMMHGVSYKKTASCRCGYCKQEFDNKEVLVEHVASCTAKKKKKWKISETGRELVKCDVCDKSMQRASLRAHKAVKHAGLGPVCEHCGRRFGNKHRLSEHCRAKHGYDKFKCTACDFQSASELALKNHERRHRGEKPFACETCDAKFHAKYLLLQHRHSHRTERLIKCDLCPATFKANNSLHMHKQACHSDTYYKCAMCARVYRCRHYVVKHLRQFHAYHGPVGKLHVVSEPGTLEA